MNRLCSSTETRRPARRRLQPRDLGQRLRTRSNLGVRLKRPAAMPRNHHPSRRTARFKRSCLARRDRARDPAHLDLASPQALFENTGAGERESRFRVPLSLGAFCGCGSAVACRVGRAVRWAALLVFEALESRPQGSGGSRLGTPVRDVSVALRASWAPLGRPRLTIGE
jgi:hypothetical protein